jgi:hypothetical protein
MMHKINIHASDQGFLTIKKEGVNQTLVTCLYPSNIPIEAGDIIHHPLLVTKQNEVFKVDQILETRKAQGDWKKSTPTWRKMILSYCPMPLM